MKKFLVSHVRALLLFVFCVLGILSGLVFGSKTLSFQIIWDYFFNVTDSYSALVVDYRVPRTIGALLCGLSLGLASALIQGLTRNPLGDTGLLGVNAGASAAVVTVFLFPSWGISPFFAAFLGSTLVVIIITVVGKSKRHFNNARLILMGAAISACLYAYVQAISQLDPNLFEQYRYWASGSLAGITVDEIKSLLPYLIMLSVIGVALGNHINIIALGHDLAKSLGTNVFLIQSVAILVASALSAITVAWVGPIAFVGLGGVHLARIAVGSDYRKLLFFSMMTGASLLLFSDVLARVLIRPSELPTGVVTGLLGAPLLYFGILRNKRHT